MAKIYTKEEMCAVTESEFDAMSKEEKINFVAQLDQLARKEVGGRCSTSITIGQMLYETGYGNDAGHLKAGTYNIFGLKGYPDHADKVGSFVKFDNFYECAKTHQEYFNYYESKCYTSFLNACDNNNINAALKSLNSYNPGSTSYSDGVRTFINKYNLTQYDVEGVFPDVASESDTNFKEAVEKSKTLKDLAKNWNPDTFNKDDYTQVVANDLCLVTGVIEKMEQDCDTYLGESDTKKYNNPDGTAAINGSFYAANEYMTSVSKVLVENTKSEAEAIYKISELIYEQDVAGAEVASAVLFKSSEAAASAYQSALNEFSSSFKQKIGDTLGTGAVSSAKGPSVTKGNIGKITASDIANAAAKTISSYNDEINNSEALLSNVVLLACGIGPGKTLVGYAWNAVKENLESYGYLINLRSKAAQTLSDSTKAAMQLILNYMDGRNEIDDSVIPDLEEKIAKCKEDIANLQAANEEQKEVCESKFDIWTREYKQSCHMEYVLSDGQRAENENEIHKFEETIEAAEKEIAYLEGFADIVNQAQQILNDTIDAVNAGFAQATNAIEGNGSFPTEISLDTSAYENYLDLVNQFNGNMNTLLEKNGIDPSSVHQINTGTESKEEAPATTEAPQSTAAAGGNGGSGGGSGSGGGGGSGSGGGGGGGGGGGSTSETTPSSTAPSTTAPSTTTPETTAPGTTAPSTTAPDTTAPSTTAPDTTAPGTTVPSETAPSTTVPSETNPQSNRNNNGTGGGGSSRRPYTEAKEELTVPKETAPEEFVEPVLPVDEETINDEYVEPIIIEPEPVVKETQIITDTVVKKSNSGLKTLGIASGIGLAVGAAALGAHAIMKAEENKDDEDDDEGDYGYDN